MSDVRKLIKNIDRGIQLRKNLPVYGSILSDTYLDYAAIELTFSAYMLSEIVLEDTALSEAERELYDRVMELLRNYLSGGTADEFQAVIDGLKQARSQVTSVMDGFTSYTDHLIVYDYVLKRMKLRYPAGELLLQEVETIDEDQFLQELMAFLVGNKDQTVVRDRLQMLMGEVPVHMTKQKLLEKIKEALTLYQGGDKTSLDNFVYMLRSASMLHKGDAGVASGVRIEEFIKKLSGMDFTGLSPEKYEEIVQELEEVSQQIFSLTDYYYSLQKVINGMYALCLASLHKSEDSGIYHICEEILRNVVKGGLNDHGLVRLEGKIEECVEKSSYLEAVLFQVKSTHGELLEELGLASAFEDYALIANLLSDSLFIDLDQVQEDEQVDTAMIQRVYGELSEELSEAVSGMQRPLKKAVMAAILEKLPVDFTNVGQIEEYIRTNLFGCQDFSEKGVALLNLKEQMADVTEWRSE